MRERGLKLPLSLISRLKQSRSREGAWIEIFKSVLMMCDFSVAPVRERGLKSHCRISPLLNLSRSREGARIEIL